MLAPPVEVELGVVAALEAASLVDEPLSASLHAASESSNAPSVARARMLTCFNLVPHLFNRSDGRHS